MARRSGSSDAASAEELRQSVFRVLLGEPLDLDDPRWRAGWELHRDELMAEARREARDWPLRHHRPEWWWRFDVPEELADQASESEAAAVRVLAELGELLPEEKDALLRDGRAARERLGTDAERCYSEPGGRCRPGVGPDARQAAIADVLEEVA